ncbi:hypothetical protein BC827DRAFT_1168356 [Russula dissimulans]|nr:hypothetical protein BC827DRAFT_1168356 [Russula dissimulans]
MPCCSLLPPWSLPNGLVRCRCASVRPTCKHHPYHPRRRRRRLLCRKFFWRCSEEFLKFQAEQYEFAQQQINLYSRKILYNKERASPTGLQARLDSIGREHGDTYIDGIQPVFDALKGPLFDSS